MAKQKKEVDVKTLKEGVKARTENKEVVKPSGFRTILTIVE